MHDFQMKVTPVEDENVKFTEAPNTENPKHKATQPPISPGAPSNVASTASEQLLKPPSDPIIESPPLSNAGKSTSGTLQGDLADMYQEIVAVDDEYNKLCIRCSTSPSLNCDDQLKQLRRDADEKKLRIRKKYGVS